MSNSVDLTQQRSSIDDWVCCLIALGRTLHDTGLRRGTAGIAWTATVDLIISSFLFLTVCSLLYAVDFVPLQVPHVHASYIFVSSLTILHEHQQRSLTQSRTCLKRFRHRLYEVDLGVGAGAIRPWLSPSSSILKKLCECRLGIRSSAAEQLAVHASGLAG